MNVLIIADGAEVKLPSGSVQIFPVDWSGEVPDDVGRALVDEGFAQIVGAPAEPMIATPEQAEILRQIADGAASMANQDPGERLTVEWDALTDDDLREIAKAIEVRVAHNTGRAKLLERLIEREDDVVAFLVAQSEAVTDADA